MRSRPVTALRSGPAQVSGGSVRLVTGSGALVSQAAQISGSGGIASGEYEPTHFVTADAAGSGDGSEGSPWTLAQAMSNAVAGNVVQVGPGTYNVSPGGLNAVPLSPANDGTSQNRIVFFAANRAVHAGSGHSIIRATSGDGNLLGTGRVDTGGSYTTYDGFSFQVAGSYSSTSEGSVVVVRNGAHGVKILGNLFDLDGFTPSGSDNWGSIFCQDVTDTEIADCRFVDQGVTGQENHASVMLYNSRDYEVHHNEFRSVPLAFFPKGVQPASPYDLVPGSFHHNQVLDCGSAFLLGQVDEHQLSSGYLDIYQNIVDGGHLTIAGYAADSAARFRIVNNLLRIYSLDSGAIYCAGGPESGNTRWNNSLFANNIVRTMDTTTLYRSYQETTAAILAARIPHNGNCYQNVSTWLNSTGWAAWQSAGLDPDSISADPLLEDAANEDYRLQGTSPCLDLGQDVLNLLGGGTGAAINAGPYILSGQTDAIGVRV